MRDMDKTAKLVAHAEAGHRMRIILDDPVVTAFFRNKREDFARAMIAAPIADDETRRNAAIQIALLDDLKMQLENAVTYGDRAVKALEKIKKEKIDA